MFLSFDEAEEIIEKLAKESFIPLRKYGSRTVENYNMCNLI